MSIPVESTSLEGSQGTESSSPGFGGLKAETDLKVLNKKLGKAAEEGDINSVQSLLSQGANVNNQDNWNESTPLHYAASRGHNEVVSVLLSNGADPNIEDRDEDTPLHDAAFRGHNEVASVLLSNGADPNTKNKVSYTDNH
ncbi:PREDICTED: tankyrase-1-like [Amphimedon queenslandica]|uniref:Uncharacterized protein n=1 Tax=Amphimedon queenslandica TaxID=400682 RepID=A0AAN0JPP8_AMPQE|nr:PREDICTED: tankyrase-1-like [Amphimedon queenslandica]|eukprot:XP_019859001.1 PREDICTED: tankyrase-1-like [Amphimedon queenslandica]